MALEALPGRSASTPQALRACRRARTRQARPFGVTLPPFTAPGRAVVQPGRRGHLLGGVPRRLLRHLGIHARLADPRCASPNGLKQGSFCTRVQPGVARVVTTHVSTHGGSSDPDAGNASQPDGATVRSEGAFAAAIPGEHKGVPDTVAVKADDPATAALQTDGWPGPIDEPPPLWA